MWVEQLHCGQGKLRLRYHKDRSYTIIAEQQMCTLCHRFSPSRSPAGSCCQQQSAKGQQHPHLPFSCADHQDPGDQVSGDRYHPSARPSWLEHSLPSLFTDIRSKSLLIPKIKCTTELMQHEAADGGISVRLRRGSKASGYRRHRSLQSRGLGRKCWYDTRMQRTALLIFATRATVSMIIHCIMIWAAAGFSLITPHMPLPSQHGKHLFKGVAEHSRQECYTTSLAFRTGPDSVYTQHTHLTQYPQMSAGTQTQGGAARLL